MPNTLGILSRSIFLLYTGDPMGTVSQSVLPFHTENMFLSFYSMFPLCAPHMHGYKSDEATSVLVAASMVVPILTGGRVKLPNLQDIESKQSALKAHLGSRESSGEPRALTPPVIPRTPPLGQLWPGKIKSNTTKHVVHKRPSYGGLAKDSASPLDIIIGLKKGNIEIGLLLKKGNIGEEVEKELSLNVSNSHIPVSGLKEDLHKMRTCDREFIVNFTLFLVDKIHVEPEKIVYEKLGMFYGEDIDLVDAERSADKVAIFGIHNRLDYLESRVNQFNDMARQALEGINSLARGLEVLPCAFRDAVKENVIEAIDAWFKKITLNSARNLGFKMTKRKRQRKHPLRRVDANVDKGVGTTVRSPYKRVETTERSPYKGFETKERSPYKHKLVDANMDKGVDKRVDKGVTL
ncbi:hypothetical protein M9H77_29597 [Catharanthus roseus]|uniref:Uncharacterized protein n=1 Tax=Catharanthus roseus TaxID=4058 RepID=A0ACB9ZVX6_CATRO|nr:hypothetical protein M9H77_29597 [Catharanthus roseus]